MDLSLLSLARMRVAACFGRTICNHPVDVLGLIMLAGGGFLILGNALFMQAGAHPAPISSPAPLARIAPQIVAPPRAELTGSFAALPKQATETTATSPAAADRSRQQLITEIQRHLGRKGFYDGAVDGIYGPRMDAAIRDFEQAAGLRAGGEPGEPLLRAIMKSSATKERAGDAPVQRREQSGTAPKMVAIQRALTDHGYGQIKANGVLDGETRAAIEKFERERKLPVTGQVTHRLSRELAAVTGRPLE